MPLRFSSRVGNNPVKIYIRRFVYMPSHLNVPTKYWELTSEVPPPPIERDINTWIIANPSDPLWDIDVLPLTYTDSRWSAFVVRADEATRRRLLPNPPLRDKPLSAFRTEFPCPNTQSPTQSPQVLQTDAISSLATKHHQRTKQSRK